MKRIMLTLPLLFSLLASPLFAQVSAEFEKTREAMQKQKDAVIAADMKLTEEEGKTFFSIRKPLQLQDRSFGDGGICPGKRRRNLYGPESQGPVG
jgi:hypothetical protein